MATPKVASIIALSALKLEKQKVCTENGAAAVGLGVFTSIETLDNDIEPISPYLQRNSKLVIRNHMSLNSTSKMNKASLIEPIDNELQKKSKKTLAKAKSFSQLQIQLPRHVETQYRMHKRLKNRVSKPNITIQFENRVDDRHRALALIKAKETAHKLRRYQTSSLTIDPKLSEEDFQEALNISRLAGKHFALAQEEETAWRWKAFEIRARGDREMHQFLSFLSKQMYSEAHDAVVRAINLYVGLRNIKANRKYTRHEFSFYEKQDNERLYLIRIKPRSLVNAFASNAAVKAMRYAHYLAFNAKKNHHVKLASEILTIAEKAYSWLHEPRRNLQHIQHQITEAEREVFMHEKVNEATDSAEKNPKQEIVKSDRQLTLQEQVAAVNSLCNTAEKMSSYRESMTRETRKKHNMISAQAMTSAERARSAGSFLVRSGSAIKSKRKHLIHRRKQSLIKITHQSSVAALQAKIRHEEDIADQVEAEHMQVGVATRESLLADLMREYSRPPNCLLDKIPRDLVTSKLHEYKATTEAGDSETEDKIREMRHLLFTRLDSFQAYFEAQEEVDECPQVKACEAIFESLSTCAAEEEITIAEDKESNDHQSLEKLLFADHYDIT